MQSFRRTTREEEFHGEQKQKRAQHAHTSDLECEKMARSMAQKGARMPHTNSPSPSGNPGSKLMRMQKIHGKCKRH